MSTAIFYSGQARTFASCFANQYWMVLRKFHEPTFFVSVADDNQAGAMELLKSRFKNVNIEYVDQPDFPEAEAMAKKYSHSGYPCSAKAQNIMRAFWSYKKAWAMMPGSARFHRYIRMRPDLWFQEFERPRDPEDVECFAPTWGSYGGINDRFAIMGGYAAEQYMNAFDVIPDLLEEGCPFHPETLTRAAIEHESACYVVQDLLAEFKIKRMGDPRSPYIDKRADYLVPEPVIGYELMRASL